MNPLLALARALHIGCALLVFGELLFLIAIAGPAWRLVGRYGGGTALKVQSWCLAVARASTVLGVLTAFAWLIAEAAVMSGLPFAQAVERETISRVVFSTTFGHVWILRLTLAAVLYGLVASARRALSAGKPVKISTALGVASVYLATLAWSGHAAAGEGADRWLQLGIDVVHLLASGAWLGALPGLVFALRTESRSTAASITQRFSIIGMASVGALVLTGFGNAWYLVGNLPALIATSYGQLLLLKLGLLGAMVALAAANRWWLAPRLRSGDENARPLLGRNARLELAAGAGIVAIVAVLGITVPGAHQQVVWPFAWTVSFAALRDSALAFAMLVVAALIACLGVFLGTVALRRRKLRSVAAGIVAFALSAVTSIWLLAVPAHPTTYAESPVRYTTSAIAQGATLFARHCTDCHGLEVHGDGHAMPSLHTAIPNLDDHAARHAVGDLFWSIAHGVANSRMPGFEPPLTDNEVWSIVQYLRAQSAAYEAQAMSADGSSNTVLVPDFAFELAGASQATMIQPRAAQPMLLVLYTLPGSLTRLRELAAAREQLSALGARVIAIPMDGETLTLQANAGADIGSILALTTQDVGATYASFARPSGKVAAPTHAELLIDGQGYLRARWLDAPTAGADRSAQIAGQIARLTHEHGPPARAHHMH